MPAVAVVLDTPDAACRARNAARDRPVPAPVLARQLEAAPRARRRAWTARDGTSSTGSRPSGGPVPEAPVRPRPEHAERRTSQGLKVVLQLSRFPWGEDPLAWLTRPRDGGRRGRVRRSGPDGPPHPDPPGRTAPGRRSPSPG